MISAINKIYEVTYSKVHPGCDRQEGTTEGAVRLRGGFGTLCDPIHTGFVEVLHIGKWGSICTEQGAEDRAEDNLVADVVGRQLGFPHGNRIDPLTARPPALTPEEAEAAPTGNPSDYGSDYTNSGDFPSDTEEAEEPVERFWLSAVGCSGPERHLIDCNLGPGFRNNNAGCSSRPHRIHVACRQFPVAEALEDVTTPDARTLPSSPRLIQSTCCGPSFAELLLTERSLPDRQPAMSESSQRKRWH